MARPCRFAAVLAAVAAGACAAAGCATAARTGGPDPRIPPDPDGPARAAAGIPGSDERVEDRARMVRQTIDARFVTDRRGVRDERVLRAMGEVPRHRFVPDWLQPRAYADCPLPIGQGQTISQPYIVAVMTEEARIDPGDRVLEIGTGSGYGAAVASRLAADVYTIEIVPELAASAGARLRELGFDNVHVKAGDGYRGWPEHAPFDAVIVTAAPDHVPQPLVDQLAPGGRLVIPVGPEGRTQTLRLITRAAAGTRDEQLMRVLFVPMTGEARGQ